jgi:predicted RNA-binding protein with PIN domain
VGPPTALVRPALELAWTVAREGDRQRPPVAVPGRLRPLVRFSRLPGRALDTVRRVLDEDPAFRERVAAAADEETLGRVPWLWLLRPDGWSDEIDSAAAAAEIRTRVDTDQRADHAAARRLGVVETARRRAEAELLEIRTAAAALTTELLELRHQRRQDVEGAQRDREGRAAAEAAHAAAERRAVLAEDRGTEVETRRAEAERRLAASEALNRQLEAQLETTRRDEQEANRARGADDRRRAVTAAELGEAVAAAGAAAADLGAALGRAALVLGGGGGAARPRPTELEDARGTRSGPDSTGTGPGRQGGKREPFAVGGGDPRRRPAPLPKAVFDDSPDAAAWLVRLPGAVLLVDGYNVTLNTWSGRDLSDQRHRLVMALAELSMRSGAEIEVVFDGADDPVHPLRAQPARQPVKITFSPPSVDADELIIERVGRLPASRPVIVATDDRRVRDQCGAAGANLISSPQLVALLGRGRDPA